MGLPWQQMTAAALAGSVFLTFVYRERIGWRLTELSMVLWLAQLVAWGVWSTFVYPHFVSPLRHLPQPGGAHWLLGHGRQIMSGSTGGPLRQW